MGIEWSLMNHVPFHLANYTLSFQIINNSEQTSFKLLYYTTQCIERTMRRNGLCQSVVNNKLYIHSPEVIKYL